MLRFGAVSALVVLIGCGGGSSPHAPDTDPATAATPSPGYDLTQETVLVGAGDIGWPGTEVQRETGKLVAEDVELGAIPFTLGDNEQSDGSYASFMVNYDPFWGGFREKTLAVVGNHEYESGNKDAFFQYFGDTADPDRTRTGWYVKRFRHVTFIALNSNVDMRRDSPQLQWLRSVLPTVQTKCVMAAWHHPRWSSGRNGDNPSTEEFWRALYGIAEVTAHGHDHWAEWMARVDWRGNADSEKGVRQFTAGGGGAVLYEEKKVVAQSRFRLPVHHKIRLRFREDSYRWEYIGLDRRAFTSDADVPNSEKLCR